jgi:hypothetical protein
MIFYIEISPGYVDILPGLLYSLCSHKYFSCAYVHSFHTLFYIFFLSFFLPSPCFFQWSFIHHLHICSLQNNPLYSPCANNGVLNLIIVFCSVYTFKFILIYWFRIYSLFCMWYTVSNARLITYDESGKNLKSSGWPVLRYYRVISLKVLKNPKQSHSP